jgi:hypothetical protein
MTPAAAIYLDPRTHEWREGVVVAGPQGPRLLAGAPEAGLRHLPGVVTGGFTDAHVHLALVDVGLLTNSRLGRVVDLGGDPSSLSTIPSAQGMRSLHGTQIGFAGAFLTAPGGYPSDRSWAPQGSIREIPDAETAARAVAEMADAGATHLKLTSNSAAGPVFADDLLDALVDLAAARGLDVVVHAEGPGEAQRVARPGVRALAHAPFTERLSDEDIVRQVGLVSWISTLAIHAGEAFEIAIDNVRRFHAAGGMIRYGTDMGNGLLPVDLHPGEVHALRAAGIRGAGLLRALAPIDPLSVGARLLFFPDGTPESADPLLSRPLTNDDLKV